MSLNLTAIFGPETTQIDTACIPSVPENPLVTNGVPATEPESSVLVTLCMEKDISETSEWNGGLV